MSESKIELPEPVSRLPHYEYDSANPNSGNSFTIRAVGVYSEQQMREYALSAVMAERERCSNVCLSLADVQSERARAEGNECAKERSIQATQCAAQIWRTVT